MLSRLLEVHELILIDAHDAASRVAALGDDGTNDLIISDGDPHGREAGMVSGGALGRDAARAGVSAFSTQNYVLSATCFSSDFLALGSILLAAWW